MDLLCRLNREKGQTFVLVTHDPAVADRADRIIHMRSGLIERDDVNLARTCGGSQVLPSASVEDSGGEAESVAGSASAPPAAQVTPAVPAASTDEEAHGKPGSTASLFDAVDEGASGDRETGE
jgi:energy-coupling factor transporter ATP-binding protein EcfA2